MKREKTAHPNIFKNLDSGIYYASVAGHEPSLKTRDFDEALDALKFISVKYDKLRNVKVHLRVKDLSAPYLENRKEELKEGTIREPTYNEAVFMMTHHVVPTFGKMSPNSIDSVVWDQARRKKKFKYEKHVRKVLAHFIKWCVKNRYAQGVPILDVVKRETRKHRILSPREIFIVYSNATNSLKLFISMALFMGMRRKEIMTMSWDRVDLVEKFLHIPKEFSKTKQSRSITIGDEALKNLIERRQALAPKGKLLSKWVFPNKLDFKRHAHLDGLRGSWARCIKRSGFVDERLTWHDLRATCETYAHKRTDVSDTQLEKYFGANIAIQRRLYAGFDYADLRGIEKTLDNQMLELPGRMAGEQKISDVETEAKDAKPQKK